ncbi:hypothetical protein Haur_5202 (plasmid) [Herpetosiphon aurantiacus DSM 785]|uniref:Uncharacterized protein n=1 Tax=Herpetosiphon aurantiacus (strain ATCC 23779 / DSM 785 / 114-95) TaxID=316274 RepID=A9B915_HERA2|nr:hypothetical protein Haur_5202 [Herpetosiphon aurantiacus DSM 785]
MYTIFTPTIGRYRKTAIYATCVSPLPTVADEPDRTTQTVVAFTVRPLPPYPDIYWNTAGVLLVHERLAAIFDAFDTPHTSRPVVFQHPITHAVLPQGFDYRIYQIEATAPILIAQSPSDDTPHSTKAGSVLLNPAIGDHTPRVCLDHTWPTVVCVHRTVQASMKARRITGGCFLSIAEWSRLQPAHGH